MSPAAKTQPAPELLDALKAPLDPAWQTVAVELAGALRRYTMFQEAVVQDGKTVMVLQVPADLHSQALRALEGLAELVAADSHRRTERQKAKQSDEPAPALTP